MRRVKSVAERFWPKVDKSAADQCWIWLGYKDGQGYGYFSRGRRRGMTKAHRVSWELTNNQTIPADKLACHACDNPSCVNPAHIWVGTNSENQRDAVLKGRHAKTRLTHCRNGHEFNSENTYFYRNRRCCRVCNRVAAAAMKARRMEALS